jgi:large subunit ribosomal protein L17
MRHRVAGRRLKRSMGMRRALFRNLVSELIRHERIRTTEAKARAIRSDAERTITLAKRGDLNARRRVLRTVTDPALVTKLFDEIAPRYAGREGGYTRILKLGPRRGDAADMVLLELVQ